MGYAGETYIIDCTRGGLTGLRNTDAIPKEMMVHGTENVSLANGGRETRRGTTKVWSPQGVFNTVQATGSDKIGNGGFASDAAGWTASNATLNSVAGGQAGNCLSIAETGGASAGKAYQDIVTVAGNLYYLTLYFKKGTADNGKFLIGTTTSESAIYASGNLSDANWTQYAKAFLATAATTRITLQTNDATAGETSLFDTVTLHAATVDTAPAGLGAYDYVRKNGTQCFVTAWDSGKLYNGVTEIASGLGTTKPYAFCTADDKMLFTDGVSAFKYWNGTAIAALSAPADWTTYPPIQFVLHGRGVSERVWAICKNGVYASLASDVTDFSDANCIFIAIDTGDGVGLVGGIEFGDRLIVFGKAQSFIIDDDSSDTDEWGYIRAQWKGGAASFRTVIQAENTVYVMMDDGTIYTIDTTDEYGYYKVSSVVHPAFVHTYISDYIDLSKIDQFHAAYSVIDRCIYWFVVRDGETAPDAALVYYIDRGPEHGWMVHGNADSASGFHARASAEISSATGEYKVYTVDGSGEAWSLMGAAYNDNGAGYRAAFKTAQLHFGDPRQNKHYRNLWVVANPTGDYPIFYRAVIDAEHVVSGAIRTTPLGVLDAFVLGTDALGAQDVQDGRGELNFIGKRIQVEAWNANAGEPFFISAVMVDWKPLGAQSESLATDTE